MSAGAIVLWGPGQRRLTSAATPSRVSPCDYGRILALPPAEGQLLPLHLWRRGPGRGGRCAAKPLPPMCLCPSPRPSPRAALAGRGRSPWWQCQDAPCDYLNSYGVHYALASARHHKITRLSRCTTSTRVNCRDLISLELNPAIPRANSVPFKSQIRTTSPLPN